MAFSVFSQRERSTIQRSTATQNRGNSLTDTPKITLENAEDIFHYIPQYKVIICSQHCSAVRNCQGSGWETRAFNTDTRLPDRQDVDKGSNNSVEEDSRK